MDSRYVAAAGFEGGRQPWQATLRFQDASPYPATLAGHALCLPAGFECSGFRHAQAIAVGLWLPLDDSLASRHRQWAFFYGITALSVIWVAEIAVSSALAISAGASGVMGRFGSGLAAGALAAALPHAGVAGSFDRMLRTAGFPA